MNKRLFYFNKFLPDIYLKQIKIILAQDMDKLLAKETKSLFRFKYVL